MARVKDVGDVRQLLRATSLLTAIHAVESAAGAVDPKAIVDRPLRRHARHVLAEWNRAHRQVTAPSKYTNAPCDTTSENDGRARSLQGLATDEWVAAFVSRSFSRGVDSLASCQPPDWKDGPALPQWFAMLPSPEPTLTSGACQALPHRIAQWARALNALWRLLIREAQDSAGVCAADPAPLRADAEADSEVDDDCLTRATQARTSLIALPHRFVVPGGAE